jgi:hypothetical protein
MKLLSDLNHYDGWKVREINRVRIYMHVTTTSDATTACGTRLNRDRYDIDEPRRHSKQILAKEHWNYGATPSAN